MIGSLIDHVQNYGFLHLTDGPRLVVQPRNVAGNEGEMRTLKCAADSNPDASYYWTKGATSREVRTEEEIVFLAKSCRK